MIRKVLPDVLNISKHPGAPRESGRLSAEHTGKPAIYTVYWLFDPGQWYGTDSHDQPAMWNRGLICLLQNCRKVDDAKLVAIVTDNNGVANGEDFVDEHWIVMASNVHLTDDVPTVNIP